MKQHKGRFSEGAMREALTDFCHRQHLSSEGSRLLRLTNNAVYLLPDERIVVRIARTGALFSRVRKVAQLAEWFEQVDAPTIRLDPRFAGQPLQAGESLATVWRYVSALSYQPTAGDLGDTLRRFHSLEPPPFELPLWNPIEDVRRRLSDADGLEQPERDFLAEWSDRLEPVLTAIYEHSERRLIHGDAHVGNLLRGTSGGLVLCDFDATSTGRALVDLAAVAVGDSRFGRTQFAEVCRSYGCDPTSDPAWAAVREARELKMIAAAVPLLRSGPGVREEFMLRLRSVRDCDAGARWTPFADLSR